VSNPSIYTTGVVNLYNDNEVIIHEI